MPATFQPKVITLTPATITEERQLAQFTAFSPGAIMVSFNKVVSQNGEAISSNSIPSRTVPLEALPPEIVAALATITDFLNVNQDAYEQMVADSEVDPQP